LRAALRGRDRRFVSQAKFQVGDLTINFASRQVFLEDLEVQLTQREFELLKTLARHAGRVVTHKQLIAAVWGPDATVDAQFVRVLIGQLRQKVEEHPSRPRLVLTEPGLGYRLRFDE
jgi:two-component system KDP operon response regulator KdpE